jgi:thiol-disulfide isomerase/thioredoxin
VVQILNDAYSDDVEMGVFLSYVFGEEIEMLVREHTCDYELLKTFQRTIRNAITTNSSYGLCNLHEPFTMLEGDVIEDFTFINKQNTETSTFDLRGKYLIVYFSATWCLPCEKLNKDFEEMIRKLESLNPFSLVTIDADYFGYQYFMNEHPWIQGYFQNDSERKRINKVYRITGYPTIFLIDQDGVIIKRHAKLPELYDELSLNDK